MIRYLLLPPNSRLLDISELEPFRVVVIIEEEVNEEWQAKVSSWLVESGCKYMLAWGKNCSSWDTSVDIANLEKYDCKEIPDDDFVMTTWHADDSLVDVFWFAKHNAFHPTVENLNTMLLHICKQENMQKFLSLYQTD